MSQPAKRDHAIVMGASMAGLAFAKALTAGFDRVTIVDRDQLPDGTADRRGVPQGRHVHGLLPAGASALDELFPGLLAEMVANGAPTGDIAERARVFLNGHRLARGRVGREVVFASRPFIEAHVTHRAGSPSQAYHAARAFGRFLTLLTDLGDPPLHETIPGFHDTRARFATLDQTVAADVCGRVAEARLEIDAAVAQKALADILPASVTRGEVPHRVVHNDAKISNVLLDPGSGEALGVVDLDTVMPGSALHDFGDLVRSSASPTDEDETDLARVAVRPEFFGALARGFLEEAGAILTRRERELLVFAGRLLALEQAIRFLTDYLDGDRYYRTSRPRQNLDRCRTQLRLFESLTASAPELEAMVGQVTQTLGG